MRASLAQVPTGFELFAESFSQVGENSRWGHFTSTNGSDWVRRANGLNDATNFPAIRGLAGGAGRFVAVSEGVSPGSGVSITTTNRIYTSTNGEDYAVINLSNLTPILEEGLTGVAYADGKFVAIGAAGRILLSTNGLDWVTVRHTDSHRWNRIRYVGGIWAAVGNAGWVAFSADGLTWTRKTVGAESELTDIAYQNGQYMIVGSHAVALLSLPLTPPRILPESLARSPEAGLQFTVTSHAGKVVVIQATADLTNWRSLSITNNEAGAILFTDPQTSDARRFYRVLQQP